MKDTLFTPKGNARRRTRTSMGLPPTAFKAVASTRFASRAPLLFLLGSLLELEALPELGAGRFDKGRLLRLTHFIHHFRRHPAQRGGDAQQRIRLVGERLHLF